MTYLINGGMRQASAGQTRTDFYRFKPLRTANEKKTVALISDEHGKTLENAAGELKRGIGYIPLDGGPTGPVRTLGKISITCVL